MPVRFDNQTNQDLGSVTMYFDDPANPSVTHTITGFGLTLYREDSPTPISVDLLGENVLVSNMPHDNTLPDNSPGGCTYTHSSDITIEKHIGEIQK